MYFIVLRVSYVFLYFATHDFYCFYLELFKYWIEINITVIFTINKGKLHILELSGLLA